MTGLTKNKKGFMIELIAMAIIGIIAVIFFAGWMYGIDIVNTALLSVNDDPNANVSLAAQETFSYMNAGLDGLKLIAFVMIFGFALASLIVAYFSGQHPMLIFVYIMVVIVLIIFGAYISNSYEELRKDDPIGLAEFGMGNWFLANLPLWIGGIGFVGIILSVSSVAIRREYA